MPRNFPPRNRHTALEEARRRFDRVLDKNFMTSEPVFILHKDSTDLVPGAVTTAVLPLSGFIELFGDLIEAQHYNMASYITRNNDEQFHIPDREFIRWKEAGCLE